MNKKNALIQNLQDAGCNEQQIDSFIAWTSENNVEEQFRILSRQRCTLLEYIHDKQRQLDCLDYLLYQMKRKNG